MKAYRYNENKIFQCEIEAQIDPLESKKQGHEIWLLPADSTFKEPLQPKEGFNVVFNGENWEYDEIPAPPEPTEDEKKKMVRDVRNSYLLDTDFTQLEDSPFTEQEKQKYRYYRQYLRDYTENPDWWLEYPKTFEEWSKNENLENNTISGV